MDATRQTAPTGARIRLTNWICSVPSAVRLLLRGDVRLRSERIGLPLVMSDGRTYVPFRETVKAPALWRWEGLPAVLHPRFRLEVLSPQRHRLHGVFRRVCIITTPFFVGLPGFRSKLWMVDPRSGDFAGLYEWDNLDGARAYADGLSRVLGLLSARGSVTAELIGGTTVDEYLRTNRAPTAALPQPTSNASIVT